VALVRAWGRLGTPGRRRVTEYPDRAAALPAAARAVRRYAARQMRGAAGNDGATSRWPGGGAATRRPTEGA
jgi:predicted DNA-binding WGR domain protein